MTKTMCKKKQGGINKIKEKEAKFICKSCAQKAHKKKHLCKPKKLKISA